MNQRNEHKPMIHRPKLIHRTDWLDRILYLDRYDDKNGIEWYILIFSTFRLCLRLAKDGKWTKSGVPYPFYSLQPTGPTFTVGKWQVRFPNRAKIEQNGEKMRKLRCKCGKEICFTSMGGVPECQGCHECKTTFAANPELHKPLQKHTPMKQFDKNTGEFSHFQCSRCLGQCNEDGE
jgi:hypothetical protein